MKLLHKYFTEMAEKGASDLHMVIDLPPMIRQSGELIPLEHPILSPESNREILFEILSPEQQLQVEKNRDFDMAYELENVGRFRCNFFFQYRGIGAVFRIIPTKILTLDDLSLPEILKTMAEYTNGLVLVTGPTGSGKSTTLAAIIDQINTIRDGHIITIEDPLEFVHQNKKCVISHREVGSHAASFDDALKVASRENPDIILVGELRDLETIALALTCAELGILVFGTLHTNSAARTIDRIINVFPADQQSQIRTMLSESLRAVIAQQLIKTTSGGRCAVNEILIGSTALANMIREGKISQISSILQTGGGAGMQSMDSHLARLIKEKKITKESAYEKAIDKSLFL
jgi:twitching motility protein PilT